MSRRVVITGMGIWSCLGTSIEEVKESEEQGVPFPDGAVAHPISEEDAKKLIEELKAEEAAKAEENK